MWAKVRIQFTQPNRPAFTLFTLLAAAIRDIPVAKNMGNFRRVNIQQQFVVVDKHF